MHLIIVYRKYFSFEMNLPWVVFCSVALSQMGYNLSPQFIQFLASRYAQKTARSTIQLDSFIQICTQLQSTAEAFKEKDANRSGNARLSYEDFLILAISRML